MASDTYRWLAKYYDYLFEMQLPLEKARNRILRSILPHVESACDLACGTGGLAVRLASRGIKTFGVDLSPDMCRIARLKARRAGLPIKIQQSDMRTFTLPQQVDLITCEFDALNHIPRKSDLRRVLKAVSRALCPGGHFAFDVNNREAFERIWSHTWFIEKDPVAMVMHGGHKPGSDRAWTDIEWFVRTGQRWVRHREHVEEVCWSAVEIREALTAAGFERIRAWDATEFFADALTHKGNRTFWLARKRLV